jgi:hypothetical protein
VAGCLGVIKGFGALHYIPRKRERKHVQRIIAVLLMTLAVINLSLSEETAFRGVKLADAKGKQADASLIFSDNNKNVVVRLADRDLERFASLVSTSGRIGKPIGVWAHLGLRSAGTALGQGFTSTSSRSSGEAA